MVSLCGLRVGSARNCPIQIVAHYPYKGVGYKHEAGKRVPAQTKGKTMFFTHTNSFSFGPAAEAAHEAYITDQTGEIGFEADGFQHCVALIKDDKAMVIGDEEGEFAPGFTYTIYWFDAESGEREELSTHGGETLDEARKAITEFLNN